MYKSKALNGYKIHIQTQNIHKYSLIKISYRLPYSVKYEKDIVLIKELFGPCSKAKSVYDFIKKCQELYNTIIDVTPSNFDGFTTVDFTLKVPISSYVDKDPLNEAFSLFKSTIYEPMFLDKEYFLKNVDYYKKSIYSVIVNALNLKDNYALHKTTILAFPSFIPFQHSLLNNPDEIFNVTYEEVRDFYHKLLKKGSIECFILYDDTKIDLYSRFESEFSFTKRKLVKPDLCTKLGKIKVCNPYIEESTNFQSEVIYVYELGLTQSFKDRILANIVSDILAGYSTSRLFKVLREERGFCYDISSNVIKETNTIIISAGISKDNYPEFKIALEEEVESLKKGSLTKEEFDSILSLYYNYLIGEQDRPENSLRRKYISIITGEDTSLEKEEEILSSLTIEDINKVLKDLKLRFSYLLKGSD